MTGKMEGVRRFFVHNFGCRATQADGAALGSRLTYDGHTEVGERAAADLVILNTCTAILFTKFLYRLSLT